ncbi:flavin reductase family protein [Streptomyces sp. Wh19]|uniref:flavin reductase family protein n=1 Tax=Streptomyces sp. Wh19 TaxID=3076629 RepID=UPI0029589860|nr:flavin reductase family protein [Streptomyces sp. Wh19]MDV9194741.1 flavin reductase family protein [Streptomyces sp. Wh19]
MSSAIHQETVRPAPVDFRRAMGRFCTGVTVIACGTDDSTDAMTANAMTSVSIDPLMLLVSIRTAGRLSGRLGIGCSFSVSVLSEAQENLSALFARPDRPRGTEAFERLGSWRGPGGSALAAGALAAFECTVEAEYPGGDHTLFLGRVTAVHQGPAEARPLLYYRGGHPRLLDPLSLPAFDQPQEVETIHA